MVLPYVLYGVARVAPIDQCGVALCSYGVAMCLYGVARVALKDQCVVALYCHVRMVLIVLPYLTMVLHCVAMYLYGVVLCSIKNVADHVKRKQNLAETQIFRRMHTGYSLTYYRK